MIPDSVLTHWKLSGSVSELGFGKINDTFKIGDETVVQRINASVFLSPKDVVGNYRRVLPYVRELVPDIVQTVNGKDFVVDVDGNVWRAFKYYDSRSFKSLPDSMCLAAGEAYGRLLNRLKDCDVELVPSIEGFHSLSHYVKEFNHHRKFAPNLPECEYVDEILQQIPDVSVPVHVIHGDCKIGNLLFDPVLPRVLKIVDLDTLMYGCPSWDFGDLVRSLLTGVEMDENLGLRHSSRIQELCRGFFSQYRLTDESSVSSYASAPSYMSFMLGIRYFTDHLAGDVYFKVEQRGSNLERARQQFSLYRRLSKQQHELTQLIESSMESNRQQ
ncbi:MAG: aminoglycoside phosphotransferase family protein [Gammaproteobacteria bacterium]|nr:aminoglycoside phosphotransferase family protein [Gammaproteobacteria bacterium]